MSAAATQLARILAALPNAGDRAFVLRHMPAWLRRQMRLAERDAAVLALAVFYPAPTGRDMAARMRRDLALYHDAGRHRGPVPADPRRALLHRVLQLSDGRVLGDRRFRAVLAGLGTRALADSSVARAAIEPDLSRDASHVIDVSGDALVAVADTGAPSAA